MKLREYVHVQALGVKAFVVRPLKNKIFRLTLEEMGLTGPFPTDLKFILNFSYLV